MGECGGCGGFFFSFLVFFLTGGGVWVFGFYGMEDLLDFSFGVVLWFLYLGFSF